MSILDNIIVPSAVVAALGCGIMAGIFFAFSVFVMKALALLPAHEGIAAMQSINSSILNPLFFVVFFGTPAAAVVAILFAVQRWGADNPLVSILFLAGGVVYLVGCFVVTIVCNVPMNDGLAAVAPTSPEGAELWAMYLVRWTAWNHVRTISALAACVSFVVALYFFRAAK